MDQTERIKKRYDRSARFFEFTENMMEKSKMGSWRELIWQQAKGKVLEVGIGTGANIKYYPEGLDITAIDFSENMLRKAKERASMLNKDVNFLQMDIQTLDFPDETFDTIVATCVFCSVPDPIKGLSELKRVCKNNGNILLLEHVRSNNKLVGFIMDVLNPLTVRLIGVNINRKTADNLTKAGLSIELEQSFMFDIVKYFRCNL